MVRIGLAEPEETTPATVRLHPWAPHRIPSSATHQRELTLAIKRARHLALLPFTSQHF